MGSREAEVQGDKFSVIRSSEDLMANKGTEANKTVYYNRNLLKVDFEHFFQKSICTKRANRGRRWARQ